MKNDDTLYPDWKGKDFTTCWGTPNVVKVSKGGAIATEGLMGGALFRPHAVSSMDGWFFTDCIRPNTAGHEHIRELFWTGIAR